jgi:hypothetical protein
MTQRLWQAQRSDRADHSREQQQKHEIGAPTDERLQGATDHRCNDRGDSCDPAHQRQFAAGANAGRNIAHHGARQRHDAGDANALDEAQRDERAD